MPALVIDYFDERLVLRTWDTALPQFRGVTKKDVIARAASGVNYPMKTTRHILPQPPAKHPVPLSVLMDPSPSGFELIRAPVPQQ